MIVWLSHLPQTGLVAKATVSDRWHQEGSRCVVRRQSGQGVLFSLGFCVTDSVLHSRNESSARWGISPSLAAVARTEPGSWARL